MGEIFELKEKLEKEEIPFVMDNWLGGHQIILFNTVGERICDAIINDRSYGNEKGLFEIMGGLTEEELAIDGVLGYLTAEEVFERFKYCYENDTNIYRKEQK